MKDYPLINIKTCYSFSSGTTFLDSLLQVTDIISFALDRSLNAIGICDHCSLIASHKFYQACKQNKIKAIIGVELDFNSSIGSSRIYIYPKNNKGYLSLLKLFSQYFPSKIYNINEIIELISFSNIIFDQLAINELNDDYSNQLVSNNNTIYQSFNTDNNCYPFIIMDKFTYRNKEDKDTYLLLGKIANYSPSEATYLYNQIEYNECDIARLNNFVSSIELDLDEFIPNKIHSSKDDNEFLDSLSRRGLLKRLSNNVSNEYSSRLDYELAVIKELGFSSYFLTVQNYVSYAKKRGILVGPSRGSVGGSLVAFAVGITEVDPVKYELYFERFLNKYRKSLPDIDIDFDDTRRGEIINYLYEKYTSRFSNIVTFSTLKIKSAFRDLAKALSLDELTTTKIANKINKSTGDINIDNPLFNQIFEEYPLLKRHLSYLIKLPRQVSIHASGVIISNTELYNHIPLLIQNKLPLTQYDMYELETQNLVKMDILGLTNLSFIRKVISSIECSLGIKLSLNKLPLEDPKAMKLLQATLIEGLFQLDASEGMKSLVYKFKPTSLEEVSAIIALYRPGPMQSIEQYLSNRTSKNITYLDPSLKAILQSTYGVIIYQEQILKIAATFANMSLDRADILLRAMKKKDRSLLQSTKQEFFDGAISLGHDLTKIKEIYEMIESFAGYGFNKAHSIAYAMLSLKEAYLKANYPSYYLTELLKQNIKDNYLIECKKLNIVILPPYINEAELDFTVTKNKIIYGFKYINNVSYNILEGIIKIRKEKGRFISIFDFVKKCSELSLNEAILQQLILAGCFLEFNIPYKILLNYLRELILFASFGDLSDPPSLTTEISYSEAKMKLLFDNVSDKPLPNIDYAYFASLNEQHILTNQLNQYQGIKLTILVKVIKKGPQSIIGLDPYGQINLRNTANIVEYDCYYELEGTVNISNNSHYFNINTIKKV